MDLANELISKRREIYSLFKESFSNDKSTNAKESMQDRIVDELLQLEDLIRSIQKCIELKYAVKIRYQPDFSIEGKSLGIDSDAIEEINELVKSVDFRKEFMAKYEVSLVEERIVFKEKLHDLLEAKLDEKTRSLGDDLEPDEGEDDTVAHSGDAQGTGLNLPNRSTNIKGKTLQVNKKITSNLIRTNQILRSSVLQSELNVDELKQQTDTLTLVNDKFDRFNALSQASTKLIKAINSSSYQEKQRVYMALGFFVTCIAWVVWKRILKYPIRLLFWLCFKFFKSILYAIGIGKNAVLYKGDDIVTPPEKTVALLSTVTDTVVSVSSATLDPHAISETIEQFFDEL